MPFNPRELCVLAYANGFTLWHFRTADGRAELTGDGDDRPRLDRGYFAAANELLRRGDQIVVNFDGDNRPTIGNLVVTSVDPGGWVSVDAC
ncbi:MAG: hypothetical protein ACREEE_08725 [Dongiaceae bacterium]